MKLKIGGISQRSKRIRNWRWNRNLLLKISREYRMLLIWVKECSKALIILLMIIRLRCPSNSLQQSSNRRRSQGLQSQLQERIFHSCRRPQIWKRSKIGMFVIISKNHPKKTTFSWKLRACNPGKRAKLSKILQHLNLPRASYQKSLIKFRNRIKILIRSWIVFKTEKVINL